MTALRLARLIYSDCTLGLDDLDQLLHPSHLGIVPQPQSFIGDADLIADADGLRNDKPHLPYGRAA